jgi:hypothetical protein
MESLSNFERSFFFVFFFGKVFPGNISRFLFCGLKNDQELEISTD